MPWDFDPTNPADTSAINAFPANERGHRSAVQGAFIAEHDEGTGWHTFQNGDVVAEGAVVGPLDGQIFIRTDAALPGIDRYDGVGASWEAAATLIPAGTVAAFVQDAAPDGWTFTGTLGDRLLKFTNTVGLGGDQAGDWDFTNVVLSGDTADYTLLEADIPSHTHNVKVYQTAGPGVNAASASGAFAFDDVSQATGGDGPHKHAAGTLVLDNTAAWRPSHVNVINCTKD